MVAICSKCGLPIPDGFHDFAVICNCLTKKEWIQQAKQKKRMIRIDREIYYFTEQQYLSDYKIMIKNKKKVD